MKYSVYAVVLSLSATLSAFSAEPSKSSPSLFNGWLREQSTAFEPWDFGGQIRLRLEHKEYFATPPNATEVDFRKVGGNADNTYVLEREKIHVGYTAEWFGAFVQGRNSASHGDERNPNPESDFIDLHQAFVTLGNSKSFPLTAKIGRQELAYGDERLVGAFDWNNIGRVFDAAKVRLENEIGWVDAFFSRVIIPDDNSFNESNDYDVFSGLYASTKTLVPKNEVQAYFLARNVSPSSPSVIGAGLPPLLSGASARDVYTVGTRVKSLPGEFGPWDYETEIAGQFGNFKSAAGPRLDHKAFAAHAAGGYTWTDALGTPRLGAEYNYASGDSDPTDGDHTTFDNLFPTNHKFYGFMDFVSWQNIHNARLTTSWKPLKKLTLQGDFHAFWLADTSDFFYQVNGSPRTTGGYGVNPSGGSYVGSELDLTATFAVTRYLTLHGGYGHFFVGDYPKNSLAPVGGATDADYVYVQGTFTF